MPGATAADTMKAVRIHRYGGPDVLAYEDAPRPTPAAGELLVRVRGAGVNPIDWKVREGYRREVLKHELPLIPGWDVCGVVEEAGPGTGRLRVGDEVFSRPDLTRNGAYAQYIVLRESEAALKPATLDPVRAAGVPLACLTAWQSLFDAADLRAGQRVLIHAAAGGVGHFAVQLARESGAYVIATASAANGDFVRGLGAHEVIDHNAVRFEEAVRDMDVVFDTMGGQVRARSWAVLRKGGVLVTIVSPPGLEDAPAHGVRGAYVFVQPNAEQLSRIAARIDAGRLAPAVETILPLSDVRAAHALSQAGHTRGKIVLRVD